MKVIKNINNNVSLCLDAKGRECIAFGKGIGFIKPPYEVPLTQVERTFYAQSHADFEGIKNVSEQMIRLAIRIVDEAEKDLHVTLLSTTALALADHIQFALQRMDAHLSLKLPMQEDMKQLYPRELRQAKIGDHQSRAGCGTGGKRGADDCPTLHQQSGEYRYRQRFS